MDKENKNLPEIKGQEEQGLAKNNEAFVLKTADLNNVETLPNLAEAKELAFDLMSSYWTPEAAGESKLCFFLKIDTRDVLDQSSGEIISLECAFFLEQKADGERSQISNGSKRLVGAILAAGIQPGTPLKITYKGKKRNRTNQFMSDDWSVKPLIIQS